MPHQPVRTARLLRSIPPRRTLDTGVETPKHASSVKTQYLSMSLISRLGSVSLTPSVTNFISRYSARRNAGQHGRLVGNRGSDRSRDKLSKLAHTTSDNVSLLCVPRCMKFLLEVLVAPIFEDCGNRLWVVVSVLDKCFPKVKQ